MPASVTSVRFGAMRLIWASDVDPPGKWRMDKRPQMEMTFFKDPDPAGNETIYFDYREVHSPTPDHIRWYSDPSKVGRPFPIPIKNIAMTRHPLVAELTAAWVGQSKADVTRDLQQRAPSLNADSAVPAYELLRRQLVAVLHAVRLHAKPLETPEAKAAWAHFGRLFSRALCPRVADAVNQFVGCSRPSRRIGGELPAPTRFSVGTVMAADSEILLHTLYPELVKPVTMELSRLAARGAKAKSWQTVPVGP